jgi:hypothetical protein
MFKKKCSVPTQIGTGHKTSKPPIIIKLIKYLLDALQIIRNKFPFVEALGLYQKQIIRFRYVSLNEFRNKNPIDLMRMLPNR